VVVLALAILLLARRWPALLVGSLLFLIALSPTFVILKWSRLIAYDRYLYFPWLGIAVALGALFRGVWGDGAGRGRTVALALAGALALAEAFAARAALAHWRDSVALWSNAVEVSPTQADAQNYLGMALEERGEFDQAEARYRLVVTQVPDYVFAWINLGALNARRMRFDEAARAFRQAGAIAPLDPNIAYEWGMSEKSAGRLAVAESLLTRAVEIDSLHTFARDQLGTVQVMRGNATAGIETIREAMRLAPLSAHPHFSLAVVLLSRRGLDREALDELEAAARLDPEWVLPAQALAWVLATSADSSYRDPARALRLAERARRLAPQTSADLLDTHAAALAANGRYEEAARLAEQAIALAEAAGNRAAAEPVRARAELYRLGKSFVDASTAGN
jgi:spermidine synthase